MAYARIVEVNYYDFTEALRKATDTGNRLEPRDGETWKKYVAENGIKEASFKTIAGGKYEGMQLVAITDGDWIGCYAYTKTEEACLKWLAPDAA